MIASLPNVANRLEPQIKCGNAWGVFKVAKHEGLVQVVLVKHVGHYKRVQEGMVDGHQHYVLAFSDKLLHLRYAGLVDEQSLYELAQKFVAKPNH